MQGIPRTIQSRRKGHMMSRDSDYERDLRNDPTIPEATMRPYAVATMTRQKLNAILAAVLTTALECQPCPESMICLAFGMDMPKYEMVRDILLGAKLVTISGNSITLTDKGIAMANKCNASIGK